MNTAEMTKEELGSECPALTCDASMSVMVFKSVNKEGKSIITIFSLSECFTFQDFIFQSIDMVPLELQPYAFKLEIGEDTPYYVGSVIDQFHTKEEAHQNWTRYIEEFAGSKVFEEETFETCVVDDASKLTDDEMRYVSNILDNMLLKINVPKKKSPHSILYRR